MIIFNKIHWKFRCYVWSESTWVQYFKKINFDIKNAHCDHLAVKIENFKIFLMTSYWHKVTKTVRNRSLTSFFVRIESKMLKTKMHMVSLNKNIYQNLSTVVKFLIYSWTSGSNFLEICCVAFWHPFYEKLLSPIFLWQKGLTKVYDNAWLNDCA